ncbi:carbohydrate-binding protein, partial [Streptosporangium algeriense]
AATPGGPAVAAAAGALVTDGTWNPYRRYDEGDMTIHKGRVYRCLQAHTARPEWEPDKTPALWWPA